MPIFLAFRDAEHERDYRRHVTDVRALSHSDRILLALGGFFIAGASPRLIRAGHIAELPLGALTVVFCGALALMHTPIFLRRPERASLIRSLRIPFHLVTQLAIHIYFLRSVTLSGMVACTSSGRPATELFVLWLVWLALYPALASIPLVAAAPLQLFMAFSTLSMVPELCRQGFEACPAGPTMYSGLSTTLSAASALLPIPPSFGQGGSLGPAAAPATACSAVLEFAILGTLLPLFWVVTAESEKRLRAKYALQRGDALTALDLESWRAPAARLATVLGLCLAALWRVLEVVHRA
jgi:hypothetical protein